MVQSKINVTYLLESWGVLFFCFSLISYRWKCMISRMMKNIQNKTSFVPVVASFCPFLRADSAVLEQTNFEVWFLVCSDEAVFGIQCFNFILVKASSKGAIYVNFSRKKTCLVVRLLAIIFPNVPSRMFVNFLHLDWPFFQ